MPISARKSSLGTRRVPQKYLPYNADDLQHGKRTGYAVEYVEHNSDEFEPFEKVMLQADLRTPPKPKVQGKKKRSVKPKTPIVEEDPEDGEMSMQLEDSFQESPTSYFANTRVTGAATSVQRGASSSRSVPRPSDIDYEKVPSPRPETSPMYSRRQSAVNNRSYAPSNLSRATSAHDMDMDDLPDENFDDSIMDHDEPPSEDEVDQRLNKSARKQVGHSRRPSFAPVRRIPEEAEERDEEDMELDEEPEEVEPAHRQKSGGRSQVLEDLQEEEEEFQDFAQGLDELDALPPEDEPMEDEAQEELDLEAEPEPEPEPEPPKKVGKKRQDEVDEERPGKKARTSDENGEVKKRGRPRKENVLREIPVESNIDEETGVRRGSRMRYKPLEWWRLEKVVYGRRDSGTSVVPTIKEIRRVPKEEIKPLGSKKRGRGRARSRQQSTAEPEAPVIFNPEQGWDDETGANGVVIDYETNVEVEKRLIFTSKMVKPKLTASGHFSFQKIFGDGDFIAAGQMVIPPGSQKPTKSTKDNTFIFFVIEGAVNFKVHRTSFVLATGAMFLVPRGNMYYIQNISDRDAKLFFAQARKIGLEDGIPEGSQSRSPSRTRRDTTASEPPPDEQPKGRGKKK